MILLLLNDKSDDDEDSEGSTQSDQEGNGNQSDVKEESNKLSAKVKIEPVDSEKVQIVAVPIFQKHSKTVLKDDALWHEQVSKKILKCTYSQKLLSQNYSK